MGGVGRGSGSFCLVKFADTWVGSVFPGVARACVQDEIASRRGER